MRVFRFLGLSLILVLLAAGTSSGATAALDWRLDPAAVVERAAAHLPGAAATHMRRAVDEQAAAREIAAEVLSTNSLERLLVVAAERGGIEARVVPEPAAEPSLARAAAALGVAVGIPVDAAELEAMDALAASLPQGVERALTRLAAAVAEAARFRAIAFAALSAAELRELERITGTPGLLDRPETRAVFDRLAARTDLGALVTGARLLARTIDAVLPALRNASWRAQDDFGTLSPESCIATDSNPLIWVTTPANDCWAFPHVLSIDPGGNDKYINNAGGASGGVPVSVHLDIAGNDDYHVAQPAGPVQFEFAVEGAGATGVGILVDVTGNDRYNAGEVLSGGPNVAYTVDLNQGAGVAGVGILADIGGSDAYNSNIVLAPSAIGGPASLAQYRVTRSQGAGLIGIGVFADIGSEGDQYNSFVTAAATPTGATLSNTSYLVADSQGAGQGFPIGVGLHVDTAGDDRYNSSNELTSAQTPGVNVTYTVQCVQGAAGACGQFTQQPLDLGVGVLVNGTGVDRYNSSNSLLGRNTIYEVTRSQGASSATVGAGIMVEGPGIPLFNNVPQIAGTGGLDYYNSINTVTGEQGSRFTVKVVQGAAEASAGVSPVGLGLPSDVSLGVLVDVGLTEDHYNSSNGLVRAQMTVDCAQGCGSNIAGQPLSGAAVGVFTDLSVVGSLTGGSGDRYNSVNTTQETFASIRKVQGAGSAPSLLLAAGAMLDLDLGDADLFNSDNVGVALLASAQGAADGALAAGVFADTAGRNRYNMSPFWPMTRSAVVSSAANLGAIAAFVDLLGQDSWGTGAGIASPPSFCAGAGLAALLQIDTIFSNVPPSVGPACVPKIDI